MTQAIEQAVCDILGACQPVKIILYAEKRTMATDKLKAFSLCVIVPESANCRTLRTHLHLAITVSVPVSLSVYTTEEWAELCTDSTSYAAWIARKVKVIYDQTAIEKALKGYLLFRTGRHFDGHNLTYLCRQAIQLDSKAFSEYLDESAALNDLYIETRYPTDLPFEIDELEVRRYLDMAERMFAAIRQQLYEGGRPHEIVQRR